MLRRATIGSGTRRRAALRAPVPGIAPVDADIIGRISPAKRIDEFQKR